jgi:hypothetical protein
MSRRLLGIIIGVATVLIVIVLSIGALCVCQKWEDKNIWLTTTDRSNGT